jgi:hypothetical protein
MSLGGGTVTKGDQRHEQEDASEEAESPAGEE